MPPLPVPDSLPAAPVMLEYSRASVDRASRARRAFLLAMTLPVAITPFLSFTYEVSPLFALREIARELFQSVVGDDIKLALIAAPFFLGCILLVWHLRLLLHAETTRVERIVVMIIAGISACLTIAFFCFDVGQVDFASLRSADFLAALTGPLVLALGAGLVFWLRWRGGRGSATPSIALHVAYIANGAMCVAGFRDNLQIGAWVTAIGSALLVVNLILLSIRPNL